MERRSTRMTANQIIPAPIGEWIDDVQWVSGKPSVEIDTVGAECANRGIHSSRIFRGERDTPSRCNLSKERTGHLYLTVADAPIAVGASAKACSTASQSACPTRIWHS